MGFAQLGNLSFRIDPTDIHYAYQIDFITIDTLGGQVIQVLGATTGDLTITGSFGQNHADKKGGLSWQLAESFHTQIRAMMDAQSIPPLNAPRGSQHSLTNFTYHDGVHNWDFKVMIKSITDPGGTGAITHTNGKFAYGYVLTLFIVEDASVNLSKIATDAFISRIASGVGWTGTNPFNGQQTAKAAMDFITKNSSDGTFTGYLAQGITKSASTAAAAAATASAPVAAPTTTKATVSTVPDAPASQKGK